MSKPPQTPTTPATDPARTDAPAFILEAETWDDAEWRRIAAMPPEAMTEIESSLWAGGPRSHPWGHNAFTGKLPDGQRATFANQAMFDAYCTQVLEHQPELDKGQVALDLLNAGLVASAKPPVI